MDKKKQIIVVTAGQAGISNFEKSIKEIVDMNTPIVDKKTEVAVEGFNGIKWKQMNRDRNRQRKYGSAVIISKVYMFGERNRPIIATLPNGDKIVSNYKNLEKAGLTHLEVK